MLSIIEVHARLVSFILILLYAQSGVEARDQGKPYATQGGRKVAT